MQKSSSKKSIKRIKSTKKTKSIKPSKSTVAKAAVLLSILGTAGLGYHYLRSKSKNLEKIIQMESMKQKPYVLHQKDLKKTGHKLW